MLATLSTWKTAIDSLPKVDDDSWAENLAAVVNMLTSGKLEVATIGTKPAGFTFGKAAFKAALSTCVPVKNRTTAANNFASAWESGIGASSWSVLVGASVGVPSTATIYGPFNSAGVSSPPVANTNAASVATAKAGLVSAIESVEPSGDGEAFASAMRDAFLALKVDVAGFNSIPYAPGTSVPAALTVTAGATA